MSPPGFRIPPVSLPAALLVACTPLPPAGFEEHNDRYQRCGARSTPVDNGEAVAISGTVHDKRDGTALDGGVDLLLIDGRGQPVKLHFGSPYTVPGPSAQRRATYDEIHAARHGDCVLVSGSRTEDGRIWVATFSNYDTHTTAGE